MIARIFTYFLIINGLIFGITMGRNRLRREIERKEFDYLYRTVEAKIRVNNVNLTKLNKEIDKMAKDLGRYNEELNPFQ